MLITNKWLTVLALVTLTIFSEVKSQNINREFDEKTIRLAAKNIIQEVTKKETGNIIIVNSNGKSDFANYLTSELKYSKHSYNQLILADTIKETRLIHELVANHRDSISYIFLITPNHAGLLFGSIGRPDIGLKLPESHLFCDWLAKTETTIRTYAIDYKENLQFQELLVKNLNQSKRIRITSETGTDITLFPRNWKTIHGEIFTAPTEEKSTGIIFVDACAYWGSPPAPIKLVIENGRVMNINELDTGMKQQKFMVTDLNTDGNSSILGELGIGTNLGAKWSMDLLESEQARGTCHFGFGLNTSFGGQNTSGIHVDYVIKDPTIIVDHKVICENGVFATEK